MTLLQCINDLCCVVLHLFAFFQGNAILNTYDCYYQLFSIVTVFVLGWWYDACGPSNLNGVYYRQGQHVGKFNGIKWHYFKGPSYSLRSTVMMIRPADFS